MRTGIVYMVATVLCIFVTSCFTGVESTKKITMPDTGEIAAQSPEDRFIESYFVQQGCDTWRIGKPFYYTDEKPMETIRKIVEIEKQRTNKFLVEVNPLENFFEAEEYHQNFFAKNPSQGYCNFSIPPKLLKLRTKFQDLLK